MAGCSCGCGTMTALTQAEDPCGCGCACCDDKPRSKEQEIDQLIRLRAAIDVRLAELQA